MTRFAIAAVLITLLSGCRTNETKRTLLSWTDPESGNHFEVFEMPTIAKKNNYLQVGEIRRLIDDDAIFSRIRFLKLDGWLLVLNENDVWAGYDYESKQILGEREWDELPFTVYSSGGTIVAQETHRSTSHAASPIGWIPRDQGEPAGRKPSQPGLNAQEEKVIATLLLAYSFGEEEPLPPALSSHIGIGASGPKGIDELRLDYDRKLSRRYIATLSEEAPEWLVDPIPRVSNELTEALASLVESNRTPIDTDGIGDYRTVPVRQLNKDIVHFSETEDPKVFWEAFDARYPANAGYSTVSRVGFSSDGSIAVLYFSWTGGPLLGLGWIHLLRKQDGQWELIGQWDRFGWTS